MSSLKTLRAAELLMVLALGAPVIAIAAVVPSDQATAESPADDAMQLQLEVVLNQEDTGQILPFVLRDGRLFAPRATLQALHFRIADGGPDEQALDEINGLEIRYESATQTVMLDVPLAQLSLDTTVLNSGSAARAQATSAPGVLLNYDLYTRHDDSSSNATAYAELRAFGMGPGVYSSSAVTRAYRTDTPDNRGWRGDTVRLDTQARWSFPSSMLSLTAGDTVTGGTLPWSRNVRVGGIRLERNFGLQPYRVTTPLPMFLGEVTVPSDVDLYVNGIKQYSGTVPVGPFQLTSQPSINGMGNAQMVITDAFGSVRTVEFPFYAGQGLLAKGLTDWSATAGVVREDYGLQSFSYANSLVAAGDVRYGLNDRLTIEGHAEAGDSLTNLGGGVVLALGRVGIVSASHAQSEGRSQSGSQSSLAYGWNSAHFNLSASTQRSRGHYRDIASPYGQDPARVNDRITLGWNSAQLGSFSASYLQLQYPGDDLQRYASGYWSRRLTDCCSVNLGVNQNMDESADRSAYLGLAVSLGNRRQLSGSMQRNRGLDSLGMEVSQSRPSDQGVDWRARVGHDSSGNTALAEAGWQGSNVRVNGGLARMYDNSYGYAGANGSLVAMGGGIFAARGIPDAFAVVSTAGIANVPVKLENRPIGTTNRKGLLLVPSLNAWQDNRMAIDPMDLPANTRIGAVEMMAVPTDRAGTVVRFSVTPIRSAVVVVHDGFGEPIPPGTPVQVQGDATPTFVGYDGEVYVESGVEQTTLRVEAASGTCTITFTFPAGSESAIPRIGPLTCQLEFPRGPVTPKNPESPS